MSSPSATTEPPPPLSWVSRIRSRALHLARDHWMILAFAAMYSAFLLYPAATLIRNGTLFGGDPAEYLLSDRYLSDPSQNPFYYACPLAPLLNYPLLGVHDLVLTYQMTDILTCVLLVGVFLATYALIFKTSSSHWGGAVGAITVGTFPIVLTEVGWGGQAQFLSMIMGLCGISLLLVLSTSRSFLRDTTLAGLCFALSYLAEPYTGTFFLLTAGIFFLVVTRFQVLKLEFWKRAIPAFVPCGMVAVYYLVAYGDILSNGVGSPIAFNLSWIFLYTLLLNTLGGSLLLVGIILLIPILYLLLLPWMPSSRGPMPTLVLAATLAYLAQFLLVTNTVFADRAIYFLAFPLAFMVGDIFSQSRQYLQEYVNRVDLGTTPRNSHRISSIRLMVLFMIPVLLGVQASMGVTSYPQALEYYGFPSSQLAELEWLSHENGSLVYVSPGTLTFPVALATNRPVYAAEQPVWFNTQEQKDDAILANSLASGTNWIDAGRIALVDSSPVWAQPAPGIFGSISSNYYLQLYRMSDGLLPVTFSPSSNPATVWSVTPWYSTNNTTVVGPDFIQHTYAWTYLTIVKNMTVTPDGVALVNLTYEFRQSFDRQIEVRLISPIISNMSVDVDAIPGGIQANIAQDYAGDWAEVPISSTMTVTSGSADLRASFVSSDNWSLPELDIFASPQRTSVPSIQLDFAFDLHTGTAITPPVTYTERNVLNSTGIRWVVVQQGVDTNFIARFQGDPAFREVQATPQFLVFERNW